LGGGELKAFFLGPAAFGSNQHGDSILHMARGGQRGVEWSRGGIFVEREFIGCISKQRIAKGFGLRYFGQKSTARLLARFEGDAAPSLDSFMGGAFEAPLTADRFDGYDFGNAKLRRLFDHPLEMIEFDERGTEYEPHGRRRRGELFQRPKGDVFLAGGLNLGEIDVPIVGDFVTLSGFDAENAGKVTGIVA